MSDSISTGGEVAIREGNAHGETPCLVPVGGGLQDEADDNARRAGSIPAPSTDGGPTAAAFMENVALHAAARRDAPLDPVMGRGKTDRREANRRTDDKLTARTRYRGKASAGRYASGADAEVSLRMVESDLRGIIAELNAAPLSEYDRAKYLGTALGKAEHALRALDEYRRKVRR